MESVCPAGIGGSVALSWRLVCPLAWIFQQVIAHTVFSLRAEIESLTASPVPLHSMFVRPGMPPTGTTSVAADDRRGTQASGLSKYVENSDACPA